MDTSKSCNAATRSCNNTLSYSIRYMNYDAIQHLMLQKLTDELPKHLSYHSVAHVKDVIQATVQIAGLEKVGGDDLILLKTAALFHDSGFIYGTRDHELRSCELARQLLPEYGYNTAQIEAICSMIMATKLPQEPKNLLEEILADADLDYLGREDFFEISDRLYSELAMYNIVNSERDWDILQVKFFESHRYFTRTAIRLRGKQKQAHLEAIKSRLAQ